LDYVVIAGRRILGSWCAVCATLFLAACGGGGGHNDAGVQTYSLGGTIAGLGDSSGLVLADGVESVAISTGSNEFSFPTRLSAGAVYSITVATQTTGETCTVAGGSGTVGSANTVLRLTLSGTETVIHSFGDTGDGVDPSGTLLQASDGYLYGMTYQGGANDLGTVFKIDPASGSESILYSFNVVPVAARPGAGLVQANDGNFYGTTTQGGTRGNGTIFKLTPSGTESVLWSFGTGSDGYLPEGNLVQADNGSLYGLAVAGGANGIGAIFEFN
jgi:uncharacterized repeat protein (TIGR03803 family)